MFAARMTGSNTKKAVFCLLIVLGFIKILAISGCANIIPPTGGPRDSLPPLLVNVEPNDSTLNFEKGKITFTFNEFVELNNIQENLVVSPLPGVAPVIESHLRTVTVRLKDSLQANTTYAINFGNAIRDINEGNELKNFTYIFSTGTHFDSLELSGRIIIAESGKPDSTLIAVLHTDLDDSAVVNERPRYFAKLDSSGYFRFRFLPSGTFRLYGMKDDGGMKRYLSNKQIFAFADSPVRITTRSTPVVLYAYSEVQDDRGSGQPTGQTKGTTKTPQDRNLRLQTNLDNSAQDLMKNLEITFNAPLKKLDTSKLLFTNEGFEPLQGVKYELDSTAKRLDVKFNWVENRGYNLIMDKEFAEDSTGRKLIRNDTISFRTKKLNEYGSLRLRFLNLDLARHPVLQFIQGDQLKYSHVFTDRNVNIKLFAPGDYDLRILFDENQNGKWDPGEFFRQHRQPEKVQRLQRRITVKASWENEIDITL